MLAQSESVLRKVVMHKHLGTAVAVVVIAVLGVMTIQRELGKTRESIKEAGAKIGNGVRAGIADGVERTIDKAAEVPGNVLLDVKKVWVPKASGDRPTDKLDPAELIGDAIEVGQGLVKAVDEAEQDLGPSLAEENQVGKEVLQKVIRRHKVAAEEFLQGIQRP